MRPSRPALAALARLAALVSRASRRLLAAIALLTVPLQAQDAGRESLGSQAPDSLSLRALHEAAMARDPRAAVPELLRASRDLRDQVIAGDRFARPLLASQLTHQSDVTALPIRLPGSDVPTPPFTRYQVALELDQPLYDAGAVQARRAIERARSTEAEADLHSRRYGVTTEVDAAVFTLLLQQVQRDVLRESRAVIERRLEEARLGVREGVVLPRDTSLLLAERLQVDEQLGVVAARTRVAREQLRALTGREITGDVAVAEVLPPADGSAPMATLERTPRTRPEFARFEATRARLAEEARATAVEARPRVSAFVQAGVGQPGLNQLRPDADAFYLGGVRVSWRPLAGRDAHRNAEALRLQQRIVAQEEQAFAEQLARVVLADRAEIDRLDTLAARDAERIAARAEVERVARLELDEGLITTADWIKAYAELAEARLVARRHEVERAYALARLHTTLALPLP